MFEALRNLLSDLVDDGDWSVFEAMDERLAAAALLVHAAAVDGSISDKERDVLRGCLKSKFDLDDESADHLIEQAEVADREAVDLYRFTSLLLRELDQDARKRLIGMMWSVVYADGQLSEFEDNLIWRAADLLGISSRDRLAMRRAMQSPGSTG